MKGEVEKVWKNETEDGRKYEVFLINGERYSLWDEDYFDQIQPGKPLEFDFRESGEYKNITRIYGNEEIETREPGQEDRKIKRIIKMSCLRSASSVLTGSRIPYENRAGKTIEIAKEFEKYVDDEGFDEPED
jgi:hypothetical protein